MRVHSISSPKSPYAKGIRPMACTPLYIVVKQLRNIPKMNWTNSLPFHSVQIYSTQDNHGSHWNQWFRQQWRKAGNFSTFGPQKAKQFLKQKTDMQLTTLYNTILQAITITTQLCPQMEHCNTALKPDRKKACYHILCSTSSSVGWFHTKHRSIIKVMIRHQQTSV